MFPGLAVAAALHNHGHAVAVVLSGRPVEAARASSAIPPGTEPILVPVRPLSLHDPLSAFTLLIGILRAFRALRRFRPEALLAMGSYTSFAPVIAARLLRIPVLLHEANAIPGSAIAWLARHCHIHTVCLTFPEAASHLPTHQHTLDTGLPLRAEFSPGIASTQASPHHFSLLIMGGSQGARAINTTVVQALATLRSSHPDLFARLRVTHLAGPTQEQAVRELYRAAALPLDSPDSPFTVIGFSNQMPKHYAEADFCISRAGASSCFELALAGLPALLIPLPGLAHDHQLYNATSMQQRGAALMTPQASLCPETLAHTLAELASHPEKRQALRTALLTIARPDATQRVAAALETCCP